MATEADLAIYEERPSGRCHLALANELLGDHEGLTVSDLRVRPTLVPVKVRPDQRCRMCWDGLGQLEIEREDPRTSLQLFGQRLRVARWRRGGR